MQLSKEDTTFISRQAAIDAVRQYCIDNQIEDGDYHADGVEYELNNLPSADVRENRWIPCSERLPEKEGRYLITCSKWGAWAVDWNIWAGSPKASWLWEQGVIAWMPMPDPYEEEEIE